MIKFITDHNVIYEQNINYSHHNNKKELSQRLTFTTSFYGIVVDHVIIVTGKFPIKH